MNSSFLMFFGVFTGAYVIYYSAMISYDLYSARKKKTSQTEEYDVSDFKDAVKTKMVPGLDDGEKETSKNESIDQNGNVDSTDNVDTTRLDKENVEAGMDDVSEKTQFTAEMTEECIHNMLREQEKVEDQWA